ncbi:OmpA family protein [bacterium SCSIO 12643]|nr:OmpA family protein [bacterium SCSIO 12643]
MRILKFGSVVAAVMMVSFGYAQNNLVPNGSFEQTEKKIKNGEGEIALATPWISPSLENQADLYGTGNKKGYGIPTNDRGYMDVDAGVNYAGFRAFSSRDKLPRTHLQVKLTKALIAGKKYCVKFNIVLSKTSKYASNNIGMYISEKKPKQKDIETYSIKPQIRNAANKVYEDQHSWQTVCGVFIAQGNERYITIGNFVATGDMVDKKDFMKKRKLKEFPQLQKEEAYYYIDDVSVINLEELDVCACDDADDGGNQMKVVYSSSTSDGMEMDAGAQVELKTVFFNKNSTSPSSAAVVREVIDLMKANPGLKIEIIGHMDKVEHKDNLKDLSEERAKAIYDYLVKNGIDASRLSYKGMKSSEPLDDSGTQASLAKNRRVSFKAL